MPRVNLALAGLIATACLLALASDRSRPNGTNVAGALEIALIEHEFAADAGFHRYVDGHSGYGATFESVLCSRYGDQFKGRPVAWCDLSYRDKRYRDTISVVRCGAVIGGAVITERDGVPCEQAMSHNNPSG
jgi:hypothetical protein